MSGFEPFPPDPQRRVRAALDAVSAGRLVILMDDEGRENEGDLVMAADLCAPEHINFMAKHGRGLICLALTPQRIDELQLPMMVRRNGSPYGTAFTVSIEARDGVSTGISAADRARTVRVAVDASSGPDDIVSPGHIFPLRAREGGVLVRAGQTEGSVDLARLAGRTPAGVICEIMNDDGTMARQPELLRFAHEHQVPMLTVADLIGWRLQTEGQIEQMASAPLRVDVLGDVTAFVFRNRVNALQYIALVKGAVDPERAVLVRVHTSCVWSDGLLAARLDGGPSVRACMKMIAGEGSGIVLYVVRPSDPDTALRELALHVPVERIDGELPPERGAGDPYPTALRDYGLGAQVLRRLGVRKLRLLSNSDRRLVGVAGHGLDVVSRVPVPMEASDG
jgi:3,4-dihydroxy 2-butanone 4-phosphate synthase/GTP cyclohydrolase II